jgi:hypothetical protein
MANLMGSDRDADVASVVGKVIADYCTIAARLINDFHKSSDGFCFRRIRMGSDPLIHLSDMRCWKVGSEELFPILPSALRHEFSLTFHRPTPAGNSDRSMWEFVLNPFHKAINAGGMRSHPSDRSATYANVGKIMVHIGRVDIEVRKLVLDSCHYRVKTWECMFGPRTNLANKGGSMHDARNLIVTVT